LWTTWMPPAPGHFRSCAYRRDAGRRGLHQRRRIPVSSGVPGGDHCRSPPPRRRPSCSASRTMSHRCGRLLMTGGTSPAWSTTQRPLGQTARPGPASSTEPRAWLHAGAGEPAGRVSMVRAVPFLPSASLGRRRSIWCEGFASGWNWDGGRWGRRMGGGSWQGEDGTAAGEGRSGGGGGVWVSVREGGRVSFGAKRKMGLRAGKARRVTFWSRPKAIIFWRVRPNPAREIYCYHSYPHDLIFSSTRL
jgi:hypothetical protein